MYFTKEMGTSSENIAMYEITFRSDFSMFW